MRPALRALSTVVLSAGLPKAGFSSRTSWMLTAPDLSMSCSPTTCTGASEVMFGDTMREPVTTIVSAAPFCVSWRSCPGVSAAFSCCAGVWSVGAALSSGWACGFAGGGLFVACAKAGLANATPESSVAIM